MSKAKTTTAQTIHGEVEYEVIECPNCGNDEKSEEAVHLVVGEPSNVRRSSVHKQVDYDGDFTHTALCQTCAENTLGLSKSWLERHTGVIWEKLPHYKQPSVVFIATCILVVLGFVFALGGAIL